MSLSVHVIFHDKDYLPPVPQVLLESDPDTSVPVCPDVPLVFTCNATELGSLSWYRDGAAFFSINSAGGTTGTPPDGLQVVINSVRQSGPNPTNADFISTLTGDNATLVGGSEICCGVLTLLDDCINVTLKSKLIWISSCRYLLRYYMYV